ncbi:MULTISPECIES: L,D-transpeptidase [Streptomycetaceae]|uniref:Putative lipoprotein n=1 Tax=Streptantibioticus cattleyicolor (strain ATCC 35852 / DSM 46488 / JCM 4925 / NBRC 14057 / NRRL 8057) TaxID=1003195 RepID=F8K4F0_STREN|nr:MULTISPECIES: Ig-like domain-containing protein [Streptomycetaceae]AEW95105.1 putative lipoprotein [Streptantibioticus cattleyicolor NRRL 8057 = DSM 46488]MYS59694.1 L,D-transpeptidase family protein [Streptomyces sp. SID5468]CCB75451.1 Lipoprotein [Streptantibioticus cattleyicolor NRRL 8057 = DSM 46488]
MITAQTAHAATNTAHGRTPRGRYRRTRHGLLALSVGAVLLGVSACGGSAGAQPRGGNGAASATASQARLSILPKNGATGVDTTGALKISTAGGKLTKVAVTSADGAAVDGAISADGSSWIPAGALHTGTRYTVAATATDAVGRSSVQHSSFTTLTPSATNYGVFNVDSGATYGVGMEVSLNFTKPVANVAAVAKAVTVTASPQVDVRGHWFGNQRLDFRPENYWAPGTKVTLHLRLNGVTTASGVYGQHSKDVSFTIGRSQTSVADNTAHTLKIYRGGSLYKTLPASLGDAQHTTYNGKMVIMEKDPVVDMDSRTVGLGNAYHIKDVPHGMRLSSSGTFAHGNYWRPVSVFGNENTSHGCVGLHDVKGGGDPSTPAAWFYNNSLIGDVVQVVNSPDTTIAPDNGWNGWNMPWSQWMAN